MLQSWNHIGYSFNSKSILKTPVNLSLVFFMVALDPVGNVSLVFNVVILFLLILGIPLIRGADKGVDAKRNFIRHGYLTLIALVLETSLIFIVMVPSFLRGLGELSGLSILDSVNFWSHIVLGTLAEVLAIIIIVPWLYKRPSKMACERMMKWMMPTVIIWIIVVATGTLIHVLGIL